MGFSGENPPVNVGDLGSVTDLGTSPGEEMATHSAILAWEIPWTRSLAG